MFNFSPFKKGDRAIDDMPIRKADDEPKKGDGRFQPGPQTKETCQNKRYDRLRLDRFRFNVHG